LQGDAGAGRQSGQDAADGEDIDPETGFDCAIVEDRIGGEVRAVQRAAAGTADGINAVADIGRDLERKNLTPNVR